MGTETLKITQPITTYHAQVKLNNPQMGTETHNKWSIQSYVK